MWLTRPVRIPSKQGGNAKVAGVCEGIGVRYQVDPVLIRLFFVVTGVFGAGVVAYLVAWMVMPRYSVPLSPIEALWTPGHPQERTHGWWLLIAFLVFSGAIGSGAAKLFGPAAVLTYLALFGMWWILHKRHPVPPRGLLTNGYVPLKEDTMNHDDLYPQPQPDLSTIKPVDGYRAPFAQQAPESPMWDPLAQSHYDAWNMELAPAEPEKKRRVWPWVVGGLVGTGAVMVVGAGIVISQLDPVYFEEDTTGIGDVYLAPTNAELKDSYASGVGEINVDLSNLTTLDSVQNVQISSGIGEVKVTLPEDVPISLICSSGIGSSNCDVGDLEARNAELDGPMLNIFVSSGIGDVDVEFANAD
ncbi:hypothetical protein CDES_03150 [Corynebacterium deserti GIMN1.010]|uniref:Phage shock protein PspC N-terminal domain-containing protein n=2 Tax=Corynebacterium TaxID=1716 RepID=A0A0M3Q961_9CORY|nr:hypothetical protein CDES_03150 [Corynebacterium deserti GIMN1.010]